jgi:hypothetical protein
MSAQPTEAELREQLRQKAREKYDNDLRWANSDLRQGIRFADEAEIRPELYPGSGWAVKRWSDGSFQYTIG